MNEGLQNAWENAISIESIKNYGLSKYGLKYIGKIEKGDRTYFFYKDENGGYWYRTDLRM